MGGAAEFGHGHREFHRLAPSNSNLNSAVGTAGSLPVQSNLEAFRTRAGGRSCELYYPNAQESLVLENASRFRVQLETLARLVMPL